MAARPEGRVPRGRVRPSEEARPRADGAFASALAEPGRQYALYLFHARDDGKWEAHFVATPGSYRDTITLKVVPAGTYRLEWVDPVSGVVWASETVRWTGGGLALTTPPYSLDVALRMRIAP